MEQMHRLGRFVKKEYGESFGNFSEKDVYAESTEYNRTMESLQCLLAGLFLPDRKGYVRDLLRNREIQDFSVQISLFRKSILFGSRFSDL